MSAEDLRAATPPKSSYLDRLLTKTNIGGGAYVQLTEKGQRLAEIAKRIVETT